MCWEKRRSVLLELRCQQRNAVQRHPALVPRTRGTGERSYGDPLCDQNALIRGVGVPVPHRLIPTFSASMVIAKWAKLEPIWDLFWRSGAGRGRSLSQ
jgi:hypothetical protein